MPESFLTYWIKRGMQTEKEREEFHRERLAKVRSRVRPGVYGAGSY